MINIKEIVNRKYEGKELVNFEYIIKGIEGPNGEEKELRVWFEKVNPEVYGIINDKPTYKVFTIDDGKVYEKIYIIPKSNMSLEMVVATGLNQLKWIFQTEAAHKEILSYTISDIIKDM